MASTTCSQVSRISSIRRGRSVSVSVSASGRSGSSLIPSAAATRRVTSAGSSVSASSTSQAPSGKPVDDLAGEPEREPGLADAAGPAQGQDADIAEQPGQLGQIPLPADEAVRLGREVSVAQHGLSSHGPSVMVAVTRQFVTPAPPAPSHGPEPGYSRYAAPPRPSARRPSPEIIAFVTVLAAGFRRSPRSPRARCSGRRPKYMTLTSAHQCCAGPRGGGHGHAERQRDALRRPGGEAPASTAVPPAQLPNGETSCASPRTGDAVALPSLTASSPLSPGRSRSSGVSSATSSSAAVAA